MKYNNIYQENNALIKEKNSFLDKIGRRRTRNYILLILLLIISLSLMNLHSTAFYKDEFQNSKFNSYLFHISISLVVGILFYKIDYKFFKKKILVRIYTFPTLLILFSMPILTNFIPKIVLTRKGAIGWIEIPGIPFRIQPSEFAKIIFVLYLSYSLSISEKQKLKTWEFIFLNSIIPLFFVVAINLQNDMGTSLHYISIFIVLMFLTEISGKLILYVTAILGTLGSLVFTILYNIDVSNMSHPYKRIQSYLIGLIQDKYDDGIGFQVRQSLMGLSNGRIFGAPYGHGTLKYDYLPEIHTDFIIISYGEEKGFLGLIALIFLFWWLFRKLKDIASNCNDPFGKYLVMGIATLIYTQFLINFCVAIGLLPVFGIPMPFMSYGGTSLITMFIAIGLALNVNKNY